MLCLSAAQSISLQLPLLQCYQCVYELPLPEKVERDREREKEIEIEREASTNYCLSSITHTVWPVDLVQVNCSPHVKSVLERWKQRSFLSRFISSSSSTSMDDEKCQYNHKYAFSEVQFSAFSACIGRKKPTNQRTS